ncbi:bZIP transcription factor 16-like [Phoenix dactylifera]|uniref:BZIP transcription factor 16-like n=1 Tax=Phoenix dactylifera TaxID=42345 RepID=A0A8B8J3P0_PHODC|nr:bZIP transcription factor 16-like [Phoenix dactylifera]XP_026659971.2 bZIP transcription factor 16-like [Phoenix dactylifera]XP_038990312.1 bZIP transcription factor 16-like [Phoenix dactylifera]
MGNGEMTTPTETQMSTSTQGQPPSSPAMVYPDWASFQAYYNSAGTSPIPPPGFLHSPWALSPQGHPYLWGPQMLPPYGTPPPYVAMYPHGGLYPHPSIPMGSYPYSPFATPSANGTAEASVAGASGAETDGKLHQGKQRSALKKSRGSIGSLDMLTGKVNDTRNASGASANGAFSQSDESGSEVSSEGSDADFQNGSQQRHGSEHGSGNDGANKASSARTTSNEVTQTLPTPIVLNPTVPFVAIPPGGLAGPATTLNIGMDYSGGPAPISAVRGKVPAAPSTAPLIPSSHEGSRDRVPPDPSIRDERELRRQKRKQSNRESARRSRLRKQAEFEELANRAETLKAENNSLKEELEHLQGDCGKLTSENATLAEKLKKHFSEESRADEQVDPVNGDG